MNAKEKPKTKVSRRRTCEDVSLPKMNLDSSLSKASNKKLSKRNIYFTPRNIHQKFSQKKLINKNEGDNSFKGRKTLRHISLNNVNRYQIGSSKPFHNFNSDIKNKNNRRKSVELMDNKIKKFFKLYSLEDIEKIKAILNNKNNINENINNCILEQSLEDSVNQLEINIKNVLNNMRLEIENQKIENISQYENTDFLDRNKKIFCSSNNLKLLEKKKEMIKTKVTNNNSLNKIIFNFSIDSIKDKNLKRSNSFNITEKTKKKVLKRMRNKIYKNLRYGKYDDIEINEKETIEEYSKGFSFHPNSKFIFIYEIIIIIANLYTFIFIPLRISKNEDVRGDDSLLDEILIYLIDIIYMVDLVIFFFKGYYDHDMKIIRNNKKIIFNYLKQDFIMDLIEAIPYNFIMKIVNVQNNNIYSGDSDFKNIFLKLLIFIKPFKIFKIIKNKNNIALEEFLENFYDSYNLENFIIFITYFLVFFLFVHLFICLHIFFSLQSYPNWITHTNVVNKNFLTKYITSFYFLVTTMTTVGYGDIICVSFIERIYHIILLAIGTILYTFLVTKIGNYLRDESLEQMKLDNDLNILENIRVSYPRMPFKLYYKIKSHLLNISKKRKKTGISFLINGIPETIKYELLLKIYANVINEFSFFKYINNSNFIFQILTSFIPITLKKEEILILEGEIIEYIIFVKDGRLSMEITIDLKDPYKSIQKYLDDYFIDINRQYLKTLNDIQSVKTAMTNKKMNYKELKIKIDKLLLDKKKFSSSNASLINGLSIDLGRLDLNKKQSDLNLNENFDIIKIFDIRKNDYFGEVHMFLEKPSPFTLKAKSRIVDAFLLRKHEALIISDNFPNIWRKIHKKSYHNLLSLKRLTIKTLRQYYNSHFYNKNKKENHFLNNDNSSSCISFFEKPSFLNKIKNNEKLNLIKSNKNTKKSHKNKIKKIKSNQIKFENKLFTDKNYKRRSTFQISNPKLRCLNDSYIESNISSLKCTQSFIKPKIDKNLGDFDNIHNNEYKSNKKSNLIINKTIERLTFRNDNENLSYLNKKSFKKDNTIDKKSSSKLINKINHKNTSIEDYEEIIKSLNDSKRENKNIDSLINETVKYNENLEDTTYSNEKERIYTLKDVNVNFSKKIRKILKKRKKYEKFKHSFELKKNEKNKNLIILISNIISNKINEMFINNQYDNLTNIIQNTLTEELYNNPLLENNNENFSKLLDSSSEEFCQKKFDHDSLKIMLSESFVIQSSYKNINKLSKGEIINNSKYKKFLENLIKQNSNKKFFNNVQFKRIISKYSEKSGKMKNDNLYFRSSTHKLIKKISKFAGSNNTLNPESKFHHELKKKKNLSNFNILEINKRKSFNDMIKTQIKKAINKEENSKRVKFNDISKNNIDIKRISSINNVNDNKSNHLNENKENKRLNFKIDDIFKKHNNNISNNKSFSSSLNNFNEKDNVSKNENKIEILNKYNDAINYSSKSIQQYNNNNNDDNKKMNKCIMF